jgi:uncharacterized protein YjiS (DUF1127 family)
MNGSTTETLASTGGLARPLAALRLLFAPITGIAGRMMRQHRIRRAHTQLLELDDRTLRDLGIDRSEIGRVVRFGRDGVGLEAGALGDSLPYPRHRR